MGRPTKEWIHKKRIELLIRMGFTRKAIRHNKMDQCMSDDAFQVRVNRMFASKGSRTP